MEQLASFAELWLWLLASLEHNIKSVTDHRLGPWVRGLIDDKMQCLYTMERRSLKQLPHIHTSAVHIIHPNATQS